MISTATLPKGAIQAFPHVSGHSRRVKAEPTKLNPLAARIMSSSGAFSTRYGTESPSSGRFFFMALGLLIVAGAFLLVGGQRPGEEHSRVAEAPLVLADDLYTLATGDYREPGARATPKVVEFDSRDRFEIERLFRLTATARGETSEEAPRAALPFRTM